MKNLLNISMLLLLLGVLMACEPAKETNEIIKKGASEMVKQPERAEVLSELKIIRDNIQLYSLDHSTYPSSLEDLELELKFSDNYQYDSKNGEVKNKTYPDL